MHPSLLTTAEESGQEPFKVAFVPHVESVYELTHSLSSSGNSRLIRTQLNTTWGPAVAGRG